MAIFLFLFIPLIFVMKHVYVWVDPPESLGREALKLIAGKAAYLNTTGFIVRTVIYFVLAIFVSSGSRLVAQAGQRRATSCCCRSSAASGRAGFPSSAWR